ncbi:MAG: Fur family transcriptional regulator, partial [Thermoactinomyces sp.]
ALDLLKKHGYKYTSKRELMMDIFLRESRYLSAREVLDRMQEDFPGLSFDTVYRNISIFEKLGIIEGTEWDGERRYRFHCNRDSHHHHIICTKCGRTQEIHLCPMNVIFGEPDNFEITGHKFEIYGICADCDGEQVQQQ